MSGLRTRLRRTGFVTALVLLAAAPARADVTEYLGQPVASVRLVIDGRESTEPGFIRVVTVSPGQPLSMRDIRESDWFGAEKPIVRVSPHRTNGLGL